MTDDWDIEGLKVRIASLLELNGNAVRTGVRDLAHDVACEYVAKRARQARSHELIHAVAECMRLRDRAGTAAEDARDAERDARDAAHHLGRVLMFAGQGEP